MKLTARDLTNRLPNSQDSSPIPLRTEPDHVGATAKDPAPRMWGEERESPRVFALLYAVALVGALLLSHLFARS
jgi:hypothetical protein